MSALEKFVSEYPKVSEETLESLAKEIASKYPALSQAIMNYIAKGDDALPALLRIAETSLNVDERTLASLIAALHIAKDVKKAIDRGIPDSIKEASASLKNLSLLRKILKTVKGRYEEASRKLIGELVTALMRRAVEAFEKGAKLKSALLMTEAVKLSNLGSEELKGKAYYNFAVLMWKMGRFKDAKKAATEAAMYFRKAGLHEYLEKVEEIIKKVEEGSS